MIYECVGTKPTITKKYLLEKQSQETYMEYYTGIPIKKGLFRSPFREDKSPTCSYWKNKSGDLILKDFSGQFYGNFISVVMEKYSCTYYMALQIIANDFGYIENKKLVKNEKPIKIVKEEFKDNGPADIRVQVQDFTEFELDWWLQYGITPDILKKFKVFSCKTVFLNGQIFKFSSKKHPMFGYYRGKSGDTELWRIYFPNKYPIRFLSNWKSIMIQGAQQLPKFGDLLVVTKSMKDVMTLYSMGITAIAPNSENLFLTENQFEKLRIRFKHMVLFYDNDRAGKAMMAKIRRTFGIDCLMIPLHYKVKDISDFYKKYGRDKTVELIKETKEWLRKSKNYQNLI